MAISRIPGYGLLANLDRQGTDLYISSNGLALTYWDVNNYRFGINTDSSVLPQDVLEVNGNILVSNGNVYSGANISYDLGSQSRWWRTIYGNTFIGNISLTTGVSSDINNVITLANVGLKGYIDSQLTAANTAWQANAQSQQSTITSLLANAATQSDLINNINANVTQANLGMKGYVDAVTTAWTANAAAQQGLIYTLQTNAAKQSDLIIGINANVTQANLGMKGYVDNSTTTANIGMKGYVDNSTTTANIGMKGYVDQANTIQNTQILAANTGMQGYVDAVTSAWTANALAQQSLLANIQASAYSNVNVAAYLVGYTGNINAGYLNVTNQLYAGSGVFGYIYGPIQTASQPGITSLGTLTSLTTSGDITVGGNLLLSGDRKLLDTTSPINIVGDVTGSGTNAAVTVSLTTLGVSPGTYGGATAIPVVTVDNKGRVTNITTLPQNFTGNILFSNTIMTSTGNVTIRSAPGGNIVLDAVNAGIVQIWGTDALQIPVGNTDQRPSSATAGYFRYNTISNNIEFFDGTNWVSPAANNTIQTAILPTDGSANTFVLTANVAAESLLVSINGTLQRPYDSYTTLNNTITFIETPLASDVVEVRTIALGLTAVSSLQQGGYGIVLNTPTMGNIQVTGNLIPSQDLTYDLGSSNYRWRDLYLSGASIKLGNIILKESAGNLSLRNYNDTADAFLNSGTQFPVTYESLSRNLNSNPFTITRVNNIITSVVYTTPLGSVTKTFTYSNGLINQISIAGAGLNGVTYIKTLGYTGSLVSSASYSTA